MSLRSEAEVRQKGLIDTIIDYVEERVDVETVKVEDVRIGVFYTGVKLSTGHGGVAFTPTISVVGSVCCPKAYGRMPEAGNMVGISLHDALDFARSPNILKSAVGVAALNAASHPLLWEEPSKYDAVEGVESLNIVEVRKSDVVTMIGAFTPYVKALKDRVRALHVLENNPQARSELPPETLSERSPDELISEADILVVTGSSLVNHTLDGIISGAKGAREFLLVGPTASMVPEPLFTRGVTVVGGVRLSDADIMLRIVSQAGGGSAIIRQCGAKYSIRRC